MKRHLVLEDSYSRSEIAAARDIARYKNVSQWRVDQLPTRPSNVNEVTRRATRDVDRQAYSSDRRWGYLFSGLFLLGAVMFVLAFEFNLIEYVF